MLIARFIPPESKLFNRISEWMKNLDGIMTWKPMRWFAVWLLFSAGVSVHAGYMDRAAFWEWDSVVLGLVKIGIITGLLVWLVYRKDYLKYDSNQVSLQNLVSHIVFALIMFMLGWGNGILTGLNYALPYVLLYLSMVMVYAVPIKGPNPTEKAQDGPFLLQDTAAKNRYMSVAIIFTAVAMIRGIRLDDPVVSTAAIVTLPFFLVPLFSNHIRHIQRAVIYPLLAMTVFVASREAWVLLLILAHFFILRLYHYFRYQTVYPTFAVYHEEMSEDKPTS